MKGDVGTLDNEGRIILLTVRYGTPDKCRPGFGAFGTLVGSRLTVNLARQGLLITKYYAPEVAVLFTRA